MIHWIETTFPNVYQLGWSGDYGWGIAIWQTIYMTIGSAFFGGLLGLAFGTGLVLTTENGITPNRTVFQILDKVVNRYDGRSCAIVIGCLPILRAPSASRFVGC